MYCKNCGILNDENAIFCNQCGHPLNADVPDKRKDKKIKNKKVKNKKEIKKITKVKYKKAKNKEYKSNPIKNFILFILILLIIIMLGVIGITGYHTWNENNIQVPNVVGFTYEEAIEELAKNNLIATYRTKTVDDEEQNGIVLSQTPIANKKCKKNKKIKLTVGILEKYIELQDFTTMDLDNTIMVLKSLKLNYKIREKITDTYKNNTIISQNPKGGTKIKQDQIIELTVAKNEEKTPLDEDNHSDEKESDIEEEKELKNF